MSAVAWPQTEFVTDAGDSGISGPLIESPLWHPFALCVGVGPRFFFPERGDSVRHVRALCRSCPTRVGCLRDAMDRNEVAGVWGGLTGRSRRFLRRDGEVTTDGECVMWDAVTGDVLIVPSGPVPTADEAAATFTAHILASYGDQNVQDDPDGTCTAGVDPDAACGDLRAVATGTP